MPVPPPPINFGNLNSIRDLSGNGQSPVFAISLGNKLYVVKKELGNSAMREFKMSQRSSIDGVYGIANKIAGGVSGRALLQAELTSLVNAASRLALESPAAVAAIKAAYNTTEKPGPTPPPPRPGMPLPGQTWNQGVHPVTTQPPFPKPGGPSNKPLPNPFDLAKWQVGPSATQLASWVIMEHVSGMLDLKHILAAPTPYDAANAHMALFEEFNLLRLGRIIVTDIFIGNNDRFMFDALDRILPDGPKVLCNRGNIIFVEQSGKLWLSGMDPLDPNGDFQLEVVGDIRDQPYFGAELKNLNWRARVAESILKAISGMLNMKMHGGAYQPGTCSQENLAKVLEGMGEALNKLMSLCESMMRAGHLPAGMRERMQVMGWGGLKERPKVTIGAHRTPMVGHRPGS